MSYKRNLTRHKYKNRFTKHCTHAYSLKTLFKKPYPILLYKLVRDDGKVLLVTSETKNEELTKFKDEAEYFLTFNNQV